MEDSLITRSKNIKSRFEDLIIYASQVEYKQSHPLRIICASKSLVGINPENPPIVLLKWIENYINNFEPTFKVPKIEDPNRLPEIITYSKFDELIINGNKHKAWEYLGYLLFASSPSSIAEYLMQFSLEKYPNLILYCWSTIRSIKFLGDQKGHPILYHCIAKFFEDKLKKNKKIGYELFCHQFQIRKTRMTRDFKIKSLLDQNLRLFDIKKINLLHEWIPEELKDIIKINGVLGIQDYLSNLKLVDINNNLILNLDSIRSLILFSNLDIEKIFDGSFIK